MAAMDNGSPGFFLKDETEGTDYRIQTRQGVSNILVMAPHGGDIEPGTSEIAEAVAGDAHSFYAFEGIKSEMNRGLHMPSTGFDEPRALEISGKARATVTIHGCRGRDAAVYLGGLDVELTTRIGEALKKAGFAMGSSSRLPGKDPRNICNRNMRGRGVQLEITRGLRLLMFEGLGKSERVRKTPLFYTFTRAIQGALTVKDPDDGLLRNRIPPDTPQPGGCGP